MVVFSFASVLHSKRQKKVLKGGLLVTLQALKSSRCFWV